MVCALRNNSFLCSPFEYIDGCYQLATGYKFRGIEGYQIRVEKGELSLRSLEAFHI